MLAERLTAQLLAGERAGDAVSVAEHLLALQGQNQRGVHMAVRARSSGVLAADVDRALTDERTLLITWLNRGTLHLVRSEDYPWLSALTAPGLMTGNARRLAQEGISPSAAERGVRIIVRALGADGPLSREHLRGRIAEGGVHTEGQALVHLLMLASLRGLIVRGPMAGRDQRYVLVRDWLGEAGPVDRELALAELARRYLRGHAPADERDLSNWSGLPLRDVRSGLRAVAGEILERPDGLLELTARPEPAPTPAPTLLGAFDPVLFGWHSRDWVAGVHQREIVAGGVFRPFALVRGRVAARWEMIGAEVSLKPLLRVSAAERRALAADAQDVARRLEGWLPAARSQRPRAQA